MKVKNIIMMFGCMLLLVGCTQSNIVNPTPEEGGAEPDFNKYNNIEINEEQLNEDVNSIYVGSDYPVASKIEVAIDEEAELVDIVVVVKDGTTKEDAATYAMVAIKGINDEAAVQDFTIGVADDSSFGGVFQYKDIVLDIYEETEHANDGTSMYEIEIPKDTYLEIIIP